MVEHYLDTVGVRGSKPLPRTTSPRVVVHKVVLPFVFSILTVRLVAGQSDFTQMTFTSISGPVRNAILYAPTPLIRSNSLPQHLVARGTFKVDLDNGIPYDVRVVQSTGYKVLDDSALETLRTWRFRPHRLVWAVIPIQFEARTSPTKHSTNAQ